MCVAFSSGETPSVVDVPRLSARLKKGANGFLLAILAFCFLNDFCVVRSLWNRPRRVSLLLVEKDCVPSEHDEPQIIIVIYLCFQIAVMCAVLRSRTVS